MVLIEFWCTFEIEDVKREKEPKNIEFYLNNESHDSDGSTESKE